MKHLKNIALASVLCAGTCLSAEGQTVPPAIPSDPEIEANIQNWLKKMTIEEKIGQMCERSQHPKLAQENDHRGKDRSDV